MQKRYDHKSYSLFLTPDGPDIIYIHLIQYLHRIIFFIHPLPSCIDS
jgi:hypothetical protein